MGKITTDFLTSQSGLLTGFASTVNLAGNFYRFNTAPSAEEADARAMRADWVITGQDLSDVIELNAQSDDSKCLTHR